MKLIIYIRKAVADLFNPMKAKAETSMPSKKSMADFCGVLSEGDYQLLKKHTENARKEWDRVF
jgi:hypothetical protein